MLGRRPVVLMFAALIAACSGGEVDGTDTVDLTTGEFTVRTTVVDDRCLDGGLNLLFMPNGVETPWEWPFPVDIYAEDELPVTYDLELRQPFGEMTVTATDAGVDRQSLTSQTNDGVLLGEAQFGQCVADIDATVQLKLETADDVSGVADLTLTNPRGDERCPPEMPDSCSVLLSFDAERR